MGHYIFLLFISFCLALSITPLLRQASIKSGALDYPNGRKLHKKATPHLGGIAITLSFFGTIVLGYMLFRSELRESMVYLAGLSIGAAIISLLGVWDDLRGLNASRKMIGQVAAALAVIPFGFAIREFSIPFVGFVEVGWQLSIPLTLFWITGIVNTVNFIDGMDGLAAGVAITISSALFIISVASNQLLMALVCLILAGSTLGFLRYNFHPAKIFMGDCGAMFLGFVLATISVRVLFRNPSITASSFVPVLIFGLPIVDASWAITRRLGRRESPFRADTLHTHHRLLDLGLTQRQAALILYAVSLLSVIAGLAAALAGSEKLAVILSASMLAVALGGIIVISCLLSSPKHKPIYPDENFHPAIGRLFHKS